LQKDRGITHLETPRSIYDTAQEISGYKARSYFDTEVFSQRKLRKPYEGTYYIEAKERYYPPKFKTLTISRDSCGIDGVIVPCPMRYGSYFETDMEIYFPDGTNYDYELRLNDDGSLNVDQKIILDGKPSTNQNRFERGRNIVDRLGDAWKAFTK
jgi:hypothetical protein